MNIEDSQTYTDEASTIRSVPSTPPTTLVATALPDAFCVAPCAE
jgi:hypothetical protein